MLSRDVFTIGKNDRLPKLRRTLTEGSVAVDVSTATLTFSMKNVNTNALKIDDASAARVTTGVDGLVEYSWAAGDTDTPGTYIGEFQATWAGTTMTFPNKDRIVIIVTKDTEA